MAKSNSAASGAKSAVAKTSAAGKAAMKSRKAAATSESAGKPGVPKSATAAKREARVKPGAESLARPLATAGTLAGALRQGKLPGFAQGIAFTVAELQAALELGGELAREIDALTDALADYGQNLAENGLADAEAFLACHSFAERAQLHATLAKKAADRFFEEYQRFSDSSARVVERAFAPLRSRFDIALDGVLMRWRR